MGKRTDHALAASHRFSYVDALIALPLFPAKERNVATNRQPCYVRALPQFCKNSFERCGQKSELHR